MGGAIKPGGRVVCAKRSMRPRGGDRALVPWRRRAPADARARLETEVAEPAPRLELSVIWNEVRHLE